MGYTVELGGRHFQITDQEDLTFDQHIWLEVATLDAKLGVHLQRKMAPIVEKASKGDNSFTEEDAEAFTHEMISEVCRDGKHLDLLAGMFNEVGVPWSRSEAEKNREFFAGRKGKEIQPIMQMLEQSIIAFFFFGLDSLKTSLNSSEVLATLSGIGEMGGGPVQGAGSASSE